MGRIIKRINYFYLLFKYSIGGSFLAASATLLEPQFKTTPTPEDEGCFVSLNSSKLIKFLEDDLTDKYLLAIFKNYDFLNTTRIRTATIIIF